MIQTQYNIKLKLWIHSNTPQTLNKKFIPSVFFITDNNTVSPLKFGTQKPTNNLCSLNPNSLQKSNKPIQFYVKRISPVRVSKSALFLYIVFKWPWPQELLPQSHTPMLSSCNMLSFQTSPQMSSQNRSQYYPTLGMNLIGLHLWGDQ